MLTRRSLLFGTSALVFSQFLLGCNGSNAGIKVRLLADSVPPQLLKEFQRQIDKNSVVNFLQSKQIAEVFELLQSWQKQPNSQEKPATGLPSLPFAGPKVAPLADLVTLGDYWLAPAIQQGLIQPLPVQDIPEWQQLPDLWKHLVRRDRQGQLSDTGEVWAAPYRWGTLMMVYRPEKFQDLGWVPTDWSDLWRSELKGKISLLDSPRTVIGLTLKKLGKSLNLSDLQTVANLSSELQSLQQQVKFYSSKAYLQPLILEDTSLAVGWSHEILPLLERENHLAGVVPKAGTILTADLWVRPTTAPTANVGNSDRLTLLKQWMGFCWNPKIAAQLSLLSTAASPLFTGKDASQIPASLRPKNLLIPPLDIQQRSEFLLPLAASTLEQYRQLWTAMRTGAVQP
ncbi:MAG TPA: extracellular solute-binding protein [Coleofasciculaceae cyanobacterium]